MNKIAQYLNAHILGEVVTNPHVRAAFATDGSPLSHAPEMVAFPRATSDIRKMARFAWQLAEKGHRLPIVTRGAGTDATGAAAGGGLVVSTTAHMHRIFEYDAKQKLVRVQPGVTIAALNDALGLHGTAIPEFHWEHDHASVGGAIASSRLVAECIDQMEVVLASGDVLQTKRLSKRELAKKKGQPGFEGDIYRAIDNLIEDNPELLDELVYNDERLDHEGYAGLEQVKDKDGSFDLTPLFVASQGSLGIISELILKADFVNQNPTVIVATFSSTAQVHDAIDIIDAINPSWVEYVDSSFLDSAAQAGKTFGFYSEASAELGSVAATLVITLNDFSERARNKKQKKILSQLKPLSPHVVSTKDFTTSDLRSLASITYWALNPSQGDMSAPPLLDGVYIPVERFEDFDRELAQLAKKHHVTLPLYGRPLDQLWYIRAVLRLGTVGDKQKLLKLSSELMKLVEKHNGTVFGAAGEGKIGSSLRKKEDQVSQMFAKVKEIFDPHTILNPGVKQGTDVKELATQIKNSHVGPAATNHLTKF